MALRDPATGKLLPGGQSLNPAGRRPKPADYLTRLHAATDGGWEIFESALAAIRDPKTREREKQTAREFVIAYLHGKPLNRVEGKHTHLSMSIDAGSVESSELIDLLPADTLLEIQAAMGRLEERRAAELPAGEIVDAELVPVALTSTPEPVTPAAVADTLTERPSAKPAAPKPGGILERVQAEAQRRAR